MGNRNTSRFQKDIISLIITSGLPDDEARIRTARYLDDPQYHAEVHQLANHLCGLVDLFERTPWHRWPWRSAFDEAPRA